MRKFLKWVFRHAEISSTPPSLQVDTSHLDRSFDLLRATTIEVSQAAARASNVLQKRLHESQSRFYSTIDAISDVVLTKDGYGRWRTLNKYGQIIFKIDQLEYFGKTNQEIQKKHPELSEVLKKSDETDEMAWNSGKQYRYEESLPCGDTTIYLDVIKTPIFNEDGSRKEMIVVGRDVTEVRNRDRRMKACFVALNSASDPITILDSEGKIFFCNDVFLHVFDIRSHFDVIGKTLSDSIKDFTEYGAMWSTVHDNRVWEGVLSNMYHINILPVKNGVPFPIYYICTLKPIKQNV